MLKQEGEDSKYALLSVWNIKQFINSIEPIKGSYEASTKYVWSRIFFLNCRLKCIRIFVRERTFTETFT